MKRGRCAPHAADAYCPDRTASHPGRIEPDDIDHLVARLIRQCPAKVWSSPVRLTVRGLRPADQRGLPPGTFAIASSDWSHPPQLFGACLLAFPPQQNVHRPGGLATQLRDHVLVSAEDSRVRVAHHVDDHAIGESSREHQGRGPVP
jgi:hypothetical protein